MEGARHRPPSRCRRALKKDPSIKAVRAGERNSTAVSRDDVKALAEIVKQYEDTILVVDAITALGVPRSEDRCLGLDVVITGSQKALMLPRVWLLPA